MSLLDQYRPPGRSNRAGRAQADNDVFEGLPVKQWGHSITHISLAPPKSETASAEDDKWAEPPMPRDFQLLQPWTQQLLRLARSGRIGNKRKPDPDTLDEDKPDDELGDDGKANLEDRGYVAKKWKPVPEALLEPEHKHFEFLAKRRKGLPSLYAPEVQNGPVISMRKTKVQKTSADGEVTLYEVLVPEGQTVEGEVTETTELGDIKPVAAAPGTVIEGVGIANDEGVVVAEHLKPVVAPRRNRPPPKKKGGPGRGKKRVTFTNPDGSTYTTIVPNATKIVPQPGQIVTHVAKGEEAKADITAEQAAAQAAARQQGQEGDEGEGEGEGDEGEGSDEEGEEGDDDDDREEGEVSDEAPSAGNTPLPPVTDASNAAPATAVAATAVKTEDVAMPDASDEPPATNDTPALPSAPSAEKATTKPREASSSPDFPLAKNSHSRQNSQASLPVPPAIEQQPDVEASTAAEAEEEAVEEYEPPPADTPATPTANEAGGETLAPNAAEGGEGEAATFEDGEEDLLGNLEKSLAGGSGSGTAPDVDAGDGGANEGEDPAA